MRKYIDAIGLSKSLKEELISRSMSQNDLANAVKSTQGEISNLLSGRFKTENNLVRRVCKYVRIDSNKYRLRLGRAPSKDVFAALVFACHGNSRRTRKVAQILRAIESLG